MQTELDKRAIRTAFGDAAAHYDGAAHLQRRIADALLARCITTSGLALDAGCGTGYALEQLSRLCAAPVALDQASAMLGRVGSNLRACADIESLPLRSASIGLYFSSLAWQWTDAARAICEAARVLQPGAQLAVATLGPDTLMELREAFRHADDAEHVRAFFAPERYPQLLRAAGFEHIDIQRSRFVAHAADFISLLREIKTLGAHITGAARRPGLYGVRAFDRAQSQYESLREAAGLPLSYDAVLITARRSAERPRL